jgi:hypothetical protein
MMQVRRFLAFLAPFYACARACVRANVKECWSYSTFPALLSYRLTLRSPYNRPDIS